jgi:hypothetical protein
MELQKPFNHQHWYKWKTTDGYMISPISLKSLRNYLMLEDTVKEIEIQK